MEQSGLSSDVTGLGSWGSGVIWRKGFKDHSFVTWEWCKMWHCSSFCLCRRRWNPMETPHIHLSHLRLLLDVPPRRWERNSSVGASCLQDSSLALWWWHFPLPGAVCGLCQALYSFYRPQRTLPHCQGAVARCCDKQGRVTQQPWSWLWLGSCTAVLLSCRWISMSEAVAA